MPRIEGHGMGKVPGTPFFRPESAQGDQSGEGAAFSSLQALERHHISRHIGRFLFLARVTSVTPFSSVLQSSTTHDLIYAFTARSVWSFTMSCDTHQTSRSMMIWMLLHILIVA